LSAGDPFDDQHGLHVQITLKQQTCRVVPFALVGEQAEVADANQAFGQNVKKKSAQELICWNGYDLPFAAMGIVAPAEGDVIVREGHEPMVRDGHALGIASQLRTCSTPPKGGLV